MELRKKKDNKAEIFTSAMNDIMFFLMLFFIIMSTLLNPSVIKLDLPAAKSSKPVHRKEVFLSINKELRYFIDSKQITFPQIEPLLNSERAKDADAVVVLRCDSSVSVQHLVKVLEIGTKLDMKMILATRKK